MTEATNLAGMLASADQNSVALIDGDRSVTYGELSAWVDAARSDLAALSVEPGSRVGLIGGNDIGFAVGLLAAFGRGAVVSPLLPSSPVDELKRKLAGVRPDLLLATGAGAWALDQSEELGCPVAPVALSASAPSPPPIEPVAADTLACAVPTSGITSDPKVVMLTHQNMAWVQEAIVNHPQGVSGADVVLAALPPSHIFGLNVVLLASLRAGATIVLQDRFDPATTLGLIADHGATVMAGAPPMWRALAATPGADTALSSLRRATSGAAALPVEVYEAVKNRFGVEVGEGYGLTETSSLVSWSLGMDVRPGSVGRPVEGVDVVVVDDEGAPVAVGDVGEIVVRGPGVFVGYLDAPEATGEVLSEDGWFWTGDVGLFDADGYLHLVDRAKDLIIVSGFNVFPGEVESVLNQHPGVAGSVVVGEPSEVTGETVVAYVASSNGSGGSLGEELAVHARQRLSRYKCPTAYRVVDELPIAPTGKVIRRRLRS